MMSHSSVFYEPYEVATGRAIGPVSEYDDAICEALVEEASRFQAIGDEGFATPEECDAAVAQAEIGVRFVRAERRLS
jgi:hypothetical protein